MKQLPQFIERCDQCPFCQRDRDSDLLCGHPPYQFLFRPRVDADSIPDTCPLPNGQPPALPEV